MGWHFFLIYEKISSLMISRKIRIIFLILFLTIITFPLKAEKISLKFSFNSNSIPNGDLNEWIESYNLLWRDWAQLKGGTLKGQFKPLDFGSNIEIGLQIPIFPGFALNISGSQFASKEEGTIAFATETGAQVENHFIRNEIIALPFKVGFSYSFPMPFLPDFSVYGNIGRHIIFVQYKSKENYDSFFSFMGRDFYYWYKKENTYRSESLGYYASLGAEYTLFKYIAFMVEGEKVWSKTDGFKGAYTYEDYSGKRESGKASIYFYESNEWPLDNYYYVLSGQKERPENEDVRNVRQGELNFGGFVFKIGIKFKF